MGGDSAAANGWRTRPTALRKVFCLGDFIIGYTSSFRMGQILQYHLDVRQQEADEPDERYMVVAFVDAVRTCLKDKGYTRIDSNQEEGGEFMVGYRSKLYVIQSDFQVQRYAEPFTAVGCGEDYALGALAVTERMKPEKRVLAALKAADRFSNGVCAPFYVETL